MGAVAQSGNIIYVNPEVARLEGIDIDRLVEYYSSEGIRLITQEPRYLEEEDRWQCFGCMGAWERNVETWRPCTIPGMDHWQPLCRRCEGTELSQHPQLIKSRIRQRLRAEGKIKKKPGKPAADPTGTAKPVKGRYLPPGEGRAPSGHRLHR